jgi:uncharacterized protein (TIGR03084 family)
VSDTRRDEYTALVDDLAAEEGALDAVVAAVDDTGATTPTAAEGWDVRATIEHLAGAEALAAAALTEPDALAGAALTEPDAFADRLAALVEAAGEPQTWADIRARWRVERARVLDALRTVGPRERFPWIAGNMSAMSFATARLMETWAHGIDVAAALGAEYPAGARLRHVADLGVRTRAFAFAVHGLAALDGDVRVELGAPDGGDPWTWGASGTDVVRGDALDFCLVVTQRRHVDDTPLTVTGAHARAWMAIAQAFAGAPTTAPRARSA